MARFIVKDWNADYKVFDRKTKKFIGSEITFQRDADVICSWLNNENKSINKVIKHSWFWLGAAIIVLFLAGISI